jgi:hypothetical protein
MCAAIEEQAPARMTSATVSPEASSGFLDFLLGNALCACPFLDRRLAILGDRLSDHPTGMACAGDAASSAATTTIARVIY